MKLYSSSLIPPSLLIPFLIMIIHTASATNLINSTCSTLAHTDPNIDYTFCTTSFQAAPASGCATLRGLCIISIRLLRYNITDTRCNTKQLMKNPGWDPYAKQCLNDCFELFSDAIPSVKQAMKYFSMKKFDDANVQISSIMDAATTCEDGFKERRGVVSPLTKSNDNVFKLSAMALAVMHMVQTGSG